MARSGSRRSDGPRLDDFHRQTSRVDRRDEVDPDRPGIDRLGLQQFDPSISQLAGDRFEILDLKGDVVDSPGSAVVPAERTSFGDHQFQTWRSLVREQAERLVGLDELLSDDASSQKGEQQVSLLPVRADDSHVMQRRGGERRNY